jgi:hypothetical protein
VIAALRSPGEEQQGRYAKHYSRNQRKRPPAKDYIRRGQYRWHLPRVGMRHLAMGGAGSKMFFLKCHRSFAFGLLENQSIKRPELA